MKRPALGTLCLAAIPFVAVCFTVPAWDRVHPMILGLPFNLFWLLCWTVLTPVCMGVAYKIETSRSSADSTHRHKERPR